jgi:predicted DNA repair protein MutK
MAGSSLLALLDDITTILDDVATMSKVALQKTAGVVGDDLALNAKQIIGVRVQREIPIVWAVAKGSFVNKVILVPAALLISTIAPWAVLPLLMIGGLYLCFEGVEKVLHKWLHLKEPEAEPELGIVSGKEDSIAAMQREMSEDEHSAEKTKILGAVRTDFILSAEIIVIALGTIANVSFPMKVAVLSTIAVVMTVGVYGLVALILKIDDAGIYLQQTTGDSWRSQFNRKLGRILIVTAPWLMKFLAVAGTLAMFLVGGGIVIHGIPAFHHWLEHLVHPLEEMPSIGGILHWLSLSFSNLVVGFGAGIVLVAAVYLAKKCFSRKSH